MNEKQYTSLKEQSKEAGMTMNKFMMKRLMEVQMFNFPTEQISVLAAYTNEQGRHINNIAHSFNAGFGSNTLLVETIEILKRIESRTSAVYTEKAKAVCEWLKQTGCVPVKISYAHKETKAPETYGLMLRLTDEQHDLLKKYVKTTHFSQKLFLQRLIEKYPFDGNHIERLRAYEGYAPYNRVANNVQQILVCAKRLDMDAARIRQIELVNNTLHTEVTGIVEPVAFIENDPKK